MYAKKSRALGLLLLSLVGPTPVQALPLLPMAPVATFCEFASLPPDELLERLVESYRGLLVFSGEALLLRDATSLEMLFEPISGGDQRSVALNESLTRLGDWVQLESQDQGLTHQAILERLRQVVQAERVRAAEQRIRADEAREDRREAPATVRHFVPGVPTDHVTSPLVLENGKYFTAAVAKSAGSALRIWSFEDLSVFREIDLPDGIAGQRFTALPVAVNSDQLLVFYLMTSILELRNWRTGELIRHFDLQEKSGNVPQVDPSFRFAVVRSKDGHHGVVELGTGKTQWLTRDSSIANMPIWSADGQYLLRPIVSDTQHRCDIYRMDPMELVGSVDVPSGTPTEVIFGQDASHLIFYDKVFSPREPILARAMGYRIVADESRGAFSLEKVWSHTSSKVSTESLWAQTQVRVGSSGRPEFVFSSQHAIQVLDASTGEEQWSVALPPQDAVSRSFLTSSGRYLLVMPSQSNVLSIWDMESRQLAWSLDRATWPYWASITESGNVLIIANPHGEYLQIWSPQETKFSD